MKRFWLSGLILALLVMMCLGLWSCGQSQNNVFAPAENTSQRVEAPKVHFDTRVLPVQVRQSMRVPIITYHHVASGLKDPYNVEPVQFDKQLAALKKAGYQSISIFELYNAIYQKGALPKKPVLITFDDGYADNYQHAYPILKKHSMKATIHLIGSRIGVAKKFMTWEMVREMSDSGLVDFQNHTWDLHDMKRDPEGKLRAPLTIHLKNENKDNYMARIIADLRKGSEAIQAVTGKPVVALAYPNGIDTPAVVKACQASGIKIAYNGYNFHTTYLDKKLDPWHIKRYNVGPEDSPQAVLKRMAKDVFPS